MPSRLFLSVLAAVATSLALTACVVTVRSTDGDADGDADAGPDGDPGDRPDDPVDPGSVGPGGACRCDGDCQAVEGHGGLCIHGICFTAPSAPCSAAGSAAECAAGSRCWNDLCWPDCASYACAGECDSDGSCAPTAATGGACDPSCSTSCPAAEPAGDGTMGAPCSNDSDCDGGTCYQDPDSGWVGGYCLGFGCAGAGSACGEGGICIADLTSDGTLVCMQDCGAGCRDGYECLSVAEGAPGFCYPYCGGPSDCPAGTTCRDEVCVEFCEGPADCGAGQQCVEGRCVTDIGEGPGPGPVPACGALPPIACTGGTAYCAELVQFSPTNSPDDRDTDGMAYDPALGYVDYPENGETWSRQYRSWLRRDAVMLVQYAAAYVACRAASWEFGNPGGVGLIDMSEADGSIPGTSVGSPGHPPGTHERGRDIDVSYFQVDTPDNSARAVCDHTVSGRDQYHCTSEPYLLDPWRTALFIGALAQSSHLRVVGVDGRIGPLVESAMTTLCRDGWLDGAACTRGVPLAYEETNTGMGWYLFHHHHFHVSYTP